MKDLGFEVVKNCIDIGLVTYFGSFGHIGYDLSCRDIQVKNMTILVFF